MRSPGPSSSSAHRSSSETLRTSRPSSTSSPSHPAYRSARTSGGAHGPGCTSIAEATAWWCARRACSGASPSKRSGRRARTRTRGGEPSALGDPSPSCCDTPSSTVRQSFAPCVARPWVLDPICGSGSSRCSGGCSCPNALVLAAACVVLMIEPANGRVPALVGGLAVMLAVNLLLMRRAFAPLARLTVADARDRPAAAGPAHPGRTAGSEVTVLARVVQRDARPARDRAARERAARAAPRRRPSAGASPPSCTTRSARRSPRCAPARPRARDGAPGSCAASSRTCA